MVTENIVSFIGEILNDNRKLATFFVGVVGLLPFALIALLLAVQFGLVEDTRQLEHEQLAVNMANLLYVAVGSCMNQAGTDPVGRDNCVPPALRYDREEMEKLFKMQALPGR